MGHDAPAGMARGSFLHLAKVLIDALLGMKPACIG